MNETAGHADCRRDDLAAYALGALAPSETADLERHLASCERCRAELDWLRPAVQLLPESVERLDPPPELRASLMDRVRSEAGSSRRWSLAPGRARGLAWRPLAGIAALLLVVGAVGAYAISGGGSGGGEEATTVYAGHSPGVTAQVVKEGDTGTLRLANVRPIPTDEVLQAWVRRGRRVVSAKTLFVPNADGTASTTIDDIEGVNAVMVTAEPRGGSAHPTSAPIVAVSIPN